MEKIQFEPGKINEKYKYLNRTVTAKDLDIFINRIDKFKVSGEDYVDLPTFGLHILNKNEIEVYFNGDKVVRYGEEDLDALHSYAKTISYNKDFEELDGELVFSTNTFEENYNNLLILKARLVKKYNDDIIADESLEKMAKKYSEIKIPDFVGTCKLYHARHSMNTICSTRDKDQILINERYKIYFREYTIRRYYDLSNIDCLKRLDTNLKHKIVHLGDKINAYSETEDGEVYVCSCKKKAIENKIKLYTRFRKDYDKEDFIEKLIDELGISFFVASELALTCKDPNEWVDMIKFKDKCCYDCNGLSKDENQIAKESMIMLSDYYATYLEAEELNQYAMFNYYENKLGEYLAERGLGVFNDGGIYFDEDLLKIDEEIKDVLDLDKLLKLLETLTNKEKEILRAKLKAQDEAEVIAYIYDRKVLNRKTFSQKKFIKKANITEKEDEAVKALKVILLGTLRIKFVNEIIDDVEDAKVKKSQNINAIMIYTEDKDLILRFDKFRTITVAVVKYDDVIYNKDEILPLEKYIELEEILKDDDSNIPSISKYNYEDAEIMYYNLEEEEIENTNKKIDNILDFMLEEGISKEIIEEIFG